MNMYFYGIIFLSVYQCVLIFFAEKVKMIRLRVEAMAIAIAVAVSHLVYVQGKFIF